MRFSSDVAFAPSHLTTHGKAVVFPAWIAEELACPSGHRAKSDPLDNDATQERRRAGRMANLPGLPQWDRSQHDDH
jgi:hypothetical protein